MAYQHEEEGLLRWEPSTSRWLSWYSRQGDAGTTCPLRSLQGMDQINMVLSSYAIFLFLTEATESSAIKQTGPHDSKSPLSPLSLFPTGASSSTMSFIVKTLSNSLDIDLVQLLGFLQLFQCFQSHRPWLEIVHAGTFSPFHVVYRHVSQMPTMYCLNQGRWVSSQWRYCVTQSTGMNLWQREVRNKAGQT